MIKSFLTVITALTSISIAADDQPLLPSIPYETNSIAFKTGDFVQLIEPKLVRRYSESAGQRETFYKGNWFINAERVIYVKTVEGINGACTIGYFTGSEEVTIRVTKQNCSKVLFELSKAD